jgi:hypothetical protein
VTAGLRGGRAAADVRARGSTGQYTSLLAGGVRNVFAVIMGSLIPVRADEELIEANSVLSETSVRLKEEKARRLAVAAAASATHSATTPPLAGS